MKGYRTPSWFRMKGVVRKKPVKAIPPKFKPTKSSTTRGKNG